MSDQTSDDVVRTELVDALRSMMDWARELPDQYLDGDPEVRAAFIEDMRAARAAIAKATP